MVMSKESTDVQRNPWLALAGLRVAVLGYNVNRT